MYMQNSRQLTCTGQGYLQTQCCLQPSSSRRFCMVEKRIYTKTILAIFQVQEGSCGHLIVSRQMLYLHTIECPRTVGSTWRVRTLCIACITVGPPSCIAHTPSTPQQSSTAITRARERAQTRELWEQKRVLSQNKTNIHLFVLISPPQISGALLYCRYPPPISEIIHTACLRLKKKGSVLQYRDNC